MTEPRYLQVLLIVTLPMMAAPALFVYLNDPLQVYRESTASSPKFFRESRYQNPGVINNYLARGALGSIIIGTSLSESFMPSEMAQLPDWGPVYKLTVYASPESNIWVEHKSVLERALATGKVKRVIWELHDRYFHDQLKEGGSENFPFELYDDSLLNDFSYVFNTESIRQSIMLLRGGSDLYWVDSVRYYRRWVDNFDELYNWGLVHLSWYPRDGFTLFNTTEELAEMSANLDDRFADIAPNIEIDKRYDFIRQELLPLVSRYPEVEFLLFFPPRPLFRYDTTQFASLLFSYRRAVFDAVAQAPNVSLYGFDNEAWITTNAANFKDRDHFHMDVNRLVAAAICADLNRIEDVESYNQKNLDLIRSYKVTSFPREDWRLHFFSKVEKDNRCAPVVINWPSREELLQVSADQQHHRQ